MDGKAFFPAAVPPPPYKRSANPNGEVRARLHPFLEAKIIGVMIGFVPFLRTTKWKAKKEKHSKRRLANHGQLFCFFRILL